MTENKELSEIEDKLARRTLSTIGRHRFFSVLIPIICGERENSVMFEVRASKLHTQPGDVCFPGGSMEEGETAMECALREFTEETGIPQDEVKVLGQFDTMYGFSGYTLYTFVGALREESLKKLAPNGEEVERTFTVPLEFFRSTSPKVYEIDVVSQVDDFPYEEAGVSPAYNWRRGRNDVPVYKYDGEVIWGMTAKVLHWFADKILND